MENQPKAKLNWWVDLVLFLTAPVLTLLVAMAGASEDVVAFFVLGVPIPLALALGIRIARRASVPVVGLVLLSIALACMFYFVLCVLCMFGCTFGGGKFNLH